MSARNFTEKPSTNHILSSESHVTNNDTASSFLVRIQQVCRLCEKEEAGKDSLCQDCRTSCHSLLSYAELPTNASFEIRRESASLTRARTRQNHSTRVFSDSRQSFVKLSSSNDNFHNNLLLNNSNTQKES